MFINDVKVRKNNRILKIVNQNDPRTIKAVILVEPLYTIKISDHIFKIFKLSKNSYAVAELKNKKPLYQFEITKNEFIYVDKQIKKLLYSD